MFHLGGVESCQDCIIRKKGEAKPSTEPPSLTLLSEFTLKAQKQTQEQALRTMADFKDEQYEASAGTKQDQADITEWDEVTNGPIVKRALEDLNEKFLTKGSLEKHHDQESQWERFTKLSTNPNLSSKDSLSCRYAAACLRYQSSRLQGHPTEFE